MNSIRSYLIQTLLIFSLLSFPPLQSSQQEISPCTIVLFGATGDLAAKKLIPALYALKKDDRLPQNTSVIGFARKDFTSETFRNYCKQIAVPAGADETSWNAFSDTLYYVSSDFLDERGYDLLDETLKTIDQKNEHKGNRLYFLATQPSSFQTVVQQLYEHELLVENSEIWSRVMLEKPFGIDLPSAIELQETLKKFMADDQVYRIDHYLAKEGLQNLLVQRFQNSWLEPILNNQWVDRIQITMSEEIGIGTRASLWEETGALRDSFQNHLLQMLALVAMEPPQMNDSMHIALEKTLVLNNLRAVPFDALNDHFIRGQYASGIINGQDVVGYHEESGVAMDSSSETFVAAKLFIDTPRWLDVPFYLIGGKRLAKQVTEIAIVLKPSRLSPTYSQNIVFIRVQPNPGIYLKIQSKIPGLETLFATVSFGFNPDNYFQVKSPDAYKKLFYDAIAGERALFVEGEEQLAAWRYIDPILECWKQNGNKGIYRYPAGSWGPVESDLLFGNTGHQWLFLDNWTLPKRNLR